MSNEAARAYFKSQGWPSMLNGDLKPVGLLDKGELIAIARKYATALQTEFSQIQTPPKLILGHTHKIVGFEESATISPGAFDKLKGIDFGKRPGVTIVTPVGGLREQTDYVASEAAPAKRKRAAHAKRGHGPRGKHRKTK